MNDITKVVVTGAAGYLGSQLMPQLLNEGFEVICLDRVAPRSPMSDACRFVQLELADQTALEAAIAGAELIVHCASIHPVNGPYTDDEYLNSNIKGTWSLYNAALARGINRIVLTSSIAAVGYARISPNCWPLPEDFQTISTDLYCLTKYTQECIARQLAERDFIRTIALRPPSFYPVPTLKLGFQLLGAFSVVDDIVNAHLAAVRVMTGRQTPNRPLQAFEAFYTTNALPYTSEDASLLEPNGHVGLRLVRKYWPHAVDWLQEHGFNGVGLTTVYDISKAKRILNWEPSFNFEQWFARYGHGQKYA